MTPPEHGFPWSHNQVLKWGTLHRRKQERDKRLPGLCPRQVPNCQGNARARPVRVAAELGPCGLFLLQVVPLSRPSNVRQAPGGPQVCSPGTSPSPLAEAVQMQTSARASSPNTFTLNRFGANVLFQVSGPEFLIFSSPLKPRGALQS